jgi:hypothetical protein
LGLPARAKTHTRHEPRPRHPTVPQPEYFRSDSTAAIGLQQSESNNLIASTDHDS